MFLFSWFAFGFRWFSYGCPMVFLRQNLWLFIAFFFVLLRFSQSSPMVSHGFSYEFLVVFHCFLWFFLWLSDGFPMVFLLLSHGFLIVFLWISYGSFGGSFGFPMVFPCYKYDFSSYHWGCFLATPFHLLAKSLFAHVKARYVRHSRMFHRKTRRQHHEIRCQSLSKYFSKVDPSTHRRSQDDVTSQQAPLNHFLRSDSETYNHD